MTALFGGVNIQTALNNVKQDIVKAAESLKNFGNLPEIPQDVGSKLKNIGDSLKGVSDSINSIRSMRDGFNWDNGMNLLFGGSNIQSALTSVKSDIEGAAKILNGFTSIPDVQAGIATKVTRVADATKVVGNAINAMMGANIPTVTVLALLPSKISAAKDVLSKTASELNTLINIQEIQPGSATKVTRVADATRVVGNAINAMMGANIPDASIIASLPSKISAAKNVVQRTATALNGLQSIQAIPEGLYTKVSRVGTSAKNVGVAVSAIGTIPQVNQGISERIRQAVNAVKKTATELNKLSGANVNNVGGLLAGVRNALNQLRSTLSSMSGSFQASSQGIGAGIKSGIVSGMSGLSGEVNAQASAAMATFSATMVAGGTTAGTGARIAFQGSFKLADIARAEMNYAVQAVNSGAGALAAAAKSAAQQAVAAAQSGINAGSPGDIARLFGREVGEYSVQKIMQGSKALINASRTVSQNVVKAWGSPSLGMNMGMSNNSSILSNMGLLAKAMPVMNGASKIINFNIAAGAFKLDARNLTQTECQKIVTLGLEGITQVNDVNIKGVK